VVVADANRTDANYVYAKMNEPLPLADGGFGACISLEGVEPEADSAPLPSLTEARKSDFLPAWFQRRVV
jgi:hypothetical protein